MLYSGKQKKILIIDDEPVFRATLTAFLQQQGHIVYQAENGADGLAAVAVYHPELVMGDLKMPGMDGHQVIQCITQRFHELPVIVVSGVSSLEAVTRALRAGARDYLMKPLRNWQIVADAITEVFASLSDDNEVGELSHHLSRLHRDDLAATQLLQAMAPPKQQKLNHWMASYESNSPLLIPEFLELNGQLLVIVMELSFMGADAAFIGAMIRFLLHGPYRQYQQGESRLLASPGNVLEYLNWNLYESGLQTNINMAVMLFSQDDEQIRFANAGLNSPSWLQRANGMPLGMLRQTDYPTFQRVLNKPCQLSFRTDNGDLLEIELKSNLQFSH